MRIVYYEKKLSDKTGMIYKIDFINSSIEITKTIKYCIHFK